MNLKSLVATFRTDTDDLADPPGWVKADVVGWLNEAEDEACLRARLIFDQESGCTEIAIAAGDTTIPINPSIFEIETAYLVDADGRTHKLLQKDRTDLDRVFPEWRTTTDKPDAIIHDDKTLAFSRIVDAAYTLRLEVYRKPTEPMVGNEDEPEIHPRHHRMLVEWAKHRAYSVPDADLFDAKKAEIALATFEDYFGPRPDASVRRRQQANKPHVNKACW